MRDIGKKIKKIRNDKKLTLTQVASDKMSAAMLSLIENGKSKPSAKNLQHIAKQLDVSISDLLDSLTREELREQLNYIESLDSNGIDRKSLESQINHIRALLPKLGHNFESACIYEIYAKSLFSYYFRYKSKFDLLEDQDWKKYLRTAEKIYENLQMENRIIRLRILLANIETIHGNYQTAINMVNDTMQRVKERKDKETESSLIELMLVKLHILDALGEFEECKRLLKEIINFMNKHLLLNYFYEIHKRGAVLYYNNGDFKHARKFVTKLEDFCKLVDNDYLYLEKEYLVIHFTEFYENNPNEAIDKIQLLETEIRSSYVLTNELKQEVSNYLYDLKARSLTKLNQPNEALPLFKDLISIEDFKHIEMHPMDLGIRLISKTYQAQCYKQLGQDDKALKYAEEVVNILRTQPHTAYYLHARNVLQEIQLQLNKKK